MTSNQQTNNDFSPAVKHDFDLRTRAGIEYDEAIEFFSDLSDHVRGHFGDETLHAAAKLDSEINGMYEEHHDLRIWKQIARTLVDGFIPAELPEDADREAVAYAKTIMHEHLNKLNKLRQNYRSMPEDIAWQLVRYRIAEAEYESMEREFNGEWREHQRKQRALAKREAKRAKDFDDGKLVVTPDKAKVIHG